MMDVQTSSRHITVVDQVVDPVVDLAGDQVVDQIITEANHPATQARVMETEIRIQVAVEPQPEEV